MQRSDFVRCIEAVYLGNEVVLVVSSTLEKKNEYSGAVWAIRASSERHESTPIGARITTYMQINKIRAISETVDNFCNGVVTVQLTRIANRN